VRRKKQATSPAYCTRHTFLLRYLQKPSKRQLRVCPGKVHFGQHWQHCQAGSPCQSQVGQRLRLNPLRRIDEQEGAVTGSHGTADFVLEVDVPRRVDEIE